MVIVHGPRQKLNPSRVIFIVVYIVLKILEGIGSFDGVILFVEQKMLKDFENMFCLGATSDGSVTWFYWFPCGIFHCWHCAGANFQLVGTSGRHSSRHAI